MQNFWLTTYELSRYFSIQIQMSNLCCCFFLNFSPYLNQRAPVFGGNQNLAPKRITKAHGSLLCGGAVVYWTEPLTLDQRVAGSIPVNAGHFLSFSKTLYPHCCSLPRCINGYPVGCERYLSLDVGMCAPLKWRLARMLPRELRRCTMSAGLTLNPVTRIIIHCKVL